MVNLKSWLPKIEWLSTYTIEISTTSYVKKLYLFETNWITKKSSTFIYRHKFYTKWISWNIIVTLHCWEISTKSKDRLNNNDIKNDI